MSSDKTDDDDIREMRTNPQINPASANRRIIQANERTKNNKSGTNSQKSSNASSSSNQSRTIPSDEAGMLAGSGTRGSDKKNLKKWLRVP